MESKSIRLVSIAAIVMAAACGRQPVGPSNVVPESPFGTDGRNAKPSGSTLHTMSFAEPQVLAAIQPLSGSISGSDETGTLRAQVGGTYTWTITDVDSCDTGDLIDRGLVGLPIKGSLTFDANQKTSSGQRVDLRMTGITQENGEPVRQGETWEIGGNSTIGFPAAITSDQAGVKVVMTNFVIGFKLNPRGKVAADQTIGCRVDFTATISPS